MPRSAGTTWPRCSASSTSPIPTSPAAAGSRRPSRSSSSSCSTASSWSRPPGPSPSGSGQPRGPAMMTRRGSAPPTLALRPVPERSRDRRGPGLPGAEESSGARPPMQVCEPRDRSDPLGTIRPGLAGRKRVCLCGLIRRRRVPGLLLPSDEVTGYPRHEIRKSLTPSMSSRRTGLSRRQWLCRIGGGFGALGLASVLAEAGTARDRPRGRAPPEADASTATRWPPGRRTSRPGRSGSSSCS